MQHFVCMCGVCACVCVCVVCVCVGMVCVCVCVGVVCVCMWCVSTRMCGLALHLVRQSSL
jgi:hypothetical protein